MTSGIYSIIAPSGKKYIGSAVNLKKRWQMHICAMRKGIHSSKALQAAYNKYGETLVFEVVEVCEVEKLLEREQFHIDSHDRSSLYNARLIAESNLGMKFSAEHIEKVATSKRGKPLSAEHRAKVGLAGLGRIVTTETRNKIALTQTGKKKRRNTSGYCGVSPYQGKFQAYYRGGGPKRHLGVYQTAELAAAMRLVYIAML